MYDVYSIYLKCTFCVSKQQPGGGGGGDVRLMPIKIHVFSFHFFF